MSNIAHPTERFVSPAEAARLLACSRRSIYGWISSGRLRAVRVGHAPNSPLRVRVSDLTEQLQLPDVRRSEHPE